MRRKAFLIRGGLFLLKEFKTIDQQIEILLNRGLIIDDINKAKEYLLTQNYYNIINGYGNFFPRDNQDNYTNHTNFNEIAKLYLFERDLKKVLLNAILSTETHLKAIFSHRFSETFSDLPYPYLDINCYDETKRLQIIETISKLSKILTKHNCNKYKNSSIYHYINTYQKVPMWVISNYIEFGTFRYMLANSKESVQNRVAKDCLNFINEHLPTPGQFTPATMISFIKNIHDIRNVCAHNNRLIGHICPSDDRYWEPLHSKYNLEPTDNRNSTYTVFLSLQCFLSKIEYAALHNSILKLTNKLSKKLTSIEINSILLKLGFPSDWHLNTKKIITQ